MARVWRIAGLATVLVVAAGLAGAPARAADDTLLEAQNILLMLGLHPGKPDGTPRPQTTQALSEFQRNNQLPVTGKLDDATMAALRQIRDTKFAHSFGTPRPDAGAPRKLQPESKPEAAPVDRVNAAPLEVAPGTRVLSGSTGLGGTALPPPLFGSPPQPAVPTTAYTPPPLVSSEPETRPFLGIMSWNWIIPFAGIPLFGFLWWFGMRRQTEAVETETADLIRSRREPNMEPAPPPVQGRREPRL
jgi:hypothetical protein